VTRYELLLALAALLSFRSFRRADVGPPAPAIE
jgi:hypothetical protein